MRKMSRMESNKEVRRVLNRNGVDLGYCQYSCVGTEIVLTGWLCKHDGSEFNGPQVQALIHDIGRYLQGFSIRGDLDNWSFTSEKISYVGEKDAHSSKSSGGPEEAQTVYEINLDELDF